MTSERRPDVGLHFAVEGASCIQPVRHALALQHAIACSTEPACHAASKFILVSQMVVFVGGP